VAIGVWQITSAAGSVGGGSEWGRLALVPIGRQECQASMRALHARIDRRTNCLSRDLS
jgi:hypothetical protein